MAIAGTIKGLLPIAHRPLVVSLESSSLCNARCTMCDRHKLGRPQMVMDFDVFRKTVDEAAAGGVKTFQLSFYGECLLDPRLAEKVRYIRGAIPDAFVQIVTNGSLLTPEKSRALLESGISHIRISAEGNTAAEYEGIRVRLGYGTLVENVRKLRELRDANPEYKTVISVAGLNLKQVPLDEAEYRRFWLQYADSVFVRDEHILELEKHETLAQKLVPCHKLLTQLPVLSDGRHTLCVYDWYGEAVCGDMNKRSLRSAWFSARRIGYKALHLMGLKKTIAMCRSCSYRPPVGRYVDALFGARNEQ